MVKSVALKYFLGYAESNKFSKFFIKILMNLFKIFINMACICCALLPCLLTSGCGLLAKDTDQGAAQADARENEDPAWQGDPVPYKADFKIIDGPESLVSKMKDLSQLVQLSKEDPDSILALERRAMQDKETAIKLLHSQCYYDGNAEIKIDENTKPVQVTLTLIPGPIFTVGEAKVVYKPEPQVPDAFLHRERVIGFWGLDKMRLPPPAFPKTVPGVEIGKPIIADDMLKAVETIPANLRKNGYPLAKVESSVFTLNKPERKLNALITVDPGLPAMMGPVVIKGEKEVNPDYLRKLAPWQPGKEPWDDVLMEDYANRLRSLGLFRSVEIKPDTENVKKAENSNQAVVLPALVEVQEGPWRSISFNARYDTDTGLGVEGIWENRNLFGNGERLRLDAPVSQQQYGLKAHFEKPAFLDRQQIFFADMSALWEDYEAYKQQSVKGEAGLVRHIAPRWWGGVSVFAEGGTMKDGENPEKPYAVISPRAGLHYDGRNNKLNPSSGTEMEFKLKPFNGYYGDQYFGALAGTLMAAGYYAPLGRKPDGKIDNTIVLAGRVEGGAMPGASPLRVIPASLRYYTGGAGSVRGYAYQAIGPRNSDGDPLGGRSYQVVNLESRFMVAENIGVVPFLDGGMVYKEEFPRIIGDMDWGTGLGLRYYTPIGPVRLDVATPLHRIEGDPPVQFYISIGQSF